MAVLLFVAGALRAQSEGVLAGEESRVLWKYAPAGSKFADVLAADGVVLALDRAGSIQALDAAAGKPLWTHTEQGRLDYGFGMALSADPEFAALLIGSDSGISAIDRRTGKRLWFTPIDGGVAGPACTAKVAVAGSADGKVYGCDLRTGKVLWQHDYVADRPDDPPGFVGEQARFAGRAARPGAAATDGKIVALSVFDQCRTLALDAATGKRLWAFQTQGWMYGRPAFGPRNVFVGSQDQRAYAVDQQTGKEVWKVQTGGRIEAGMTPTERFVYFGSCDANVYAVDMVVGQVKWKYATEHAPDQGAPIYGRPVVRGDTVCLAAMAGKVYALDRATGELRWQVCPSPQSEIEGDMAADGTRLFVTTRKTKNGGESAVIAIDGR